MEFTQFVRVPFTVEAIEITEDNIDEIAALIGNIRTNKEETKFIAIDRRVIPTIQRAYVGFFLTRLGDNYRCYAPKVFTEQFQPFAFSKTVVFEPKQVNEVYAEELTTNA